MEQHTNNLNGTSELHRIRTLQLFAGAGGGLLADLLLGHQPVCAVEIDQHCQQVLSQRQKDGVLPWFPIFGDVTTFDGRPWRGLVEAVCGGFPCQDISSAGKGAGIRGKKSGLWEHFRRIVREVNPRIVFVENSPILRTRGLSVVLRDLAAMGYDARWGVLGAGHVKAPNLRERIWILAYSKRRERAGALRGSNIRMGRKLQSIPWDGTPESALSRFRGMDDGMAPVVDRTNAVRNGQVPIVAATAWNLLKP